MVWQRKRHPDDVSTPIAVAVSDFCRRAKAPASPLKVRDALSLLSEDDDFRVRALTDEEPAARPLGPYALVDIVLGAAATLASTREESGYYEVVAALLAERDSKTPLPPLPARALPPLAAAVPVPEQEPKAKKPKKPSPAEALRQRIAPIKRSSAELEQEDEPAGRSSELDTLPPPLRSLPSPRGRYVQVEGSKQKLDDLHRLAAKDEVAALVAAEPNRFSLRATLDRGYVARGRPVSVADVEALLSRHLLADALAVREREALLGGLMENRGSFGRTGHALGLNTRELEQLTEALGVQREVREIRERFVKEALAPKNLSQRLDLHGRARYLEDLKIERKFNEQLKKELAGLYAQTASPDDDPEAAAVSVAKKYGLNRELLARVSAKLGVFRRNAR